MFERLRDAFREAVENFHRELEREDVPEAVHRLRQAMREEVIDARARLSELEDDIERAVSEATREEEERDTCRRRERMARDIGDSATADVASEYASRHARRAEVLRAKAAALEEELRLRRAELDEMLERIRKAGDERAGLAARAGRTSAREGIRDADELFEELDRMAEKMGDDARVSDAYATDPDLSDGAGADAWAEAEAADAERRGDNAERRLAELKRRMAEE